MTTRRSIHSLPRVLLTLALPVLGQAVPTTINYQGRLTDNSPSQTPVNATVQMQFAIYDAASGGARLWQEPAADNTGTPVAVSTGIFNYVLGNSVAIPSSVFSGATSVRYLQITLNPAGGAEILAPRQLVTATGYASLADNAGSAVTAVTAATAGNSSQLGGVAANGYLLSGGTAFDSARLGGSLAAGWQKALTTANCPANQFYSSIAQDGTAGCAAPPTFTETDPKVGTLTTGRVPYWNTTSLTNGAMFDSGNRIGISTTSPIAPFHVSGANPVSLGTAAATGAGPQSVSIQGRYAYVVSAASGPGLLQIFDIADPAAIPAALGSAATGFNPVSIDVQGRYAYVVNFSSDTLQVFDISNPASIPAPLGTVTTGSSPRSVYVQGRYAYVVNQNSGNLQVFDISNPAAIPAAVGTTTTGFGPVAVYVQGRYAYVVSRDSLQTFDISNPSAIGAAAGTSLPITYGNADLYVQGRFAYLTSYNSGGCLFRIFDVSSAASLNQIGGDTETGICDMRVVGVQGRYAYISVQDGAPSLRVYDVSSPAAVVLLASVSTTTGAARVQGRLVYVLNNNGLQAFDLGGAYIQQLEAGGIETGTLNANSNAQFNGDAQVKGGLVVGSGGIYSAGDVGIGGRLKISGGAPGAGKVLTSDAAGLASWQTTTGGVGGVTASAPLSSSGGATPDISLTGIVGVANGGTGTATPTTNTSYQSRVAAFCTAGNSIRVINVDGSVTCQNSAYSAGPGLSLTGTQFSLTGLVAPSPPQTDSTVDFGSNSLYAGAMTLGADALGLIAYRDVTNGDLMVGHCANTNCTALNPGTAVRVDPSANNVGNYAAITIGTDGFGLISYHDTTTGDLKVAHCGDTNCTAGNATLSRVDGDGIGGAIVFLGLDTSITIGTDGLGLISYYDSLNQNLKVAHCANTACTAADAVTALDVTGDVGTYTSIIIGSDGLGLVSYYDTTNGDLKVAHCSNLLCTAATLTAIDPAASGAGSTLALGSDGLGIIAYNNTPTTLLKVAHCSNLVCTAAVLTTIGAAVAGNPSIAVGEDGLPLIAYANTFSSISVAHCSNAACTGFSNIQFTATGGNASITLGNDRLPLMAHIGASNVLKVAHCANLFCVPNYKRR